MVPQAVPEQPEPETLQVTVVLVVPETVAVNCWVRPRRSEATEAGETVTVMVGGGGGGGGDEPPPPPPQAAREAASTTRTAGVERRDKSGKRGVTAGRTGLGLTTASICSLGKAILSHSATGGGGEEGALTGIARTRIMRVWPCRRMSGG